MARRDFYTSKEWVACREAYAASVFYLCERCKRPGYIVHHKNPITDENVSDPNITLNWDNLELLCIGATTGSISAKKINQKRRKI
jgi:hypothetical protein